MAQNRPTAAIADHIAGQLRRWRPSSEITPDEIREACDMMTDGEFPPRALDRLADMVERRLQLGATA